MTVSSTTSRADYTGNGATTLFTVPFYFVDPTHLKVLRTVIATGVATTLTYGTDYTVAGTGVSTGGSITMTTAPTSLQRLSILRNVPILQNTHYVANDPFPASSHEAALDLLTMETQQLNEILSRTVTFPSSDPTGIGASIPNSVARAGKVFTFDSNGAPSVTNNAVDVTAVAANAANINTVATNITNVNAVAGNATNINTVASNNTNVTNVGANISNVNSVAANATNINTNATNITAIQNASSNATAAASSATAASGSATAASGSAASALTYLNNFKGQYYGPLASNPTLDPLGNAMGAGDLYWNTTIPEMRVYNGSAWVAAYVSLGSALLAANNLSDVTNAATARANIGAASTGKAIAAAIVFGG